MKVRWWVLLPALVLAAHGARAAEIGFAEDFVLADDRARAIDRLVPGSEEYFYYQALNEQNLGHLDRVEQVLAAWAKQHPAESPRRTEIRNRQALLRFPADPTGSIAYLKRMLGLAFDHERPDAGAATVLPTVLDPARIEPARFLENGASAGGGLDDLEDSALEAASRGELTIRQLRELLSRLGRPSIENLPQLVVRELGDPSTGGFGSLAIHAQLLGTQLEECARLMPALLGDDRFVGVRLQKLQPGPDEDTAADAAARQAHLGRLWAFVGTLPPAMDPLKANVLYHRLAHDRALGVFDRGRFLQYLQLRPDRGTASAASPSGGRSGLDNVFSAASGLAAVTDDRPLVDDYLASFFATDASYEIFAPFFPAATLKRAFAEAKILAGAGDQERWYALFGDPSGYQSLKERVDVEFAPTCRGFYAPEEPVVLEADLKNVGTLVLRVYAVNTTSYYRDKLAEVDEDINLEGLMPTRERTFTYDDPPLRRVRRRFELPEISRRGVYVVELTGGGRSARAIVRKGRLRLLERATASGHLFTVLDERNARVGDAALWVGGREYGPDAVGAVTVPFGAESGYQPVVITAGEFSTLARFLEQGQRYDLQAGFFVERESLLRGARGRVLVRPRLLLNGEPVDISLLRNPVLTVEAVGRDGVRSSSEARDLSLSARRESLQEFTVPEGLAELRCTLAGSAPGRTRDDPVALSDTAAFPVNGIDDSDDVSQLLLARLPAGYALDYLGRSGDPRAGKTVFVKVKRRGFRQPLLAPLRTDARGRIALGELREIEWVEADPGDAGASRRTWHLPADQCTTPRALHARVGETLSVACAGQVGGAASEAASLLETRGDSYVRDWGTALALERGFLTISGLPAGDYELFLKRAAIVIAVRVTPGETRDGWVLGESRLLGTAPAPPLQVDAVDVNEAEVRIRIANAGDDTRVHVVSTRYLPEYGIFEQLAPGPADPAVIAQNRPESHYRVSREVGEEARYILERKYARRYPGNLLPRPSLLLAPVPNQQVDVPLPLPSPVAAAPSPRSEAHREYQLLASSGEELVLPPAPERSPNLDFLPVPAGVLANLVPGPDGVVHILRGDLGEGQHLHVLATNSGSAAYRQAVLPERPLEPRDLRLLQPLPPAKHFAEQKLVTVVAPGRADDAADATTTRAETFDSLERVYQLYTTLSPGPALAEFGFVLRWPRLTSEEKRETYSRHVCHELNFFLFRKDPAFFRDVVLPYLGNKKDKTFLDRWLLGEDLAAFAAPWAYGRLNVVEQILLGRRLPGEAEAVRRHLEGLSQLKAPNRELLDLLFRTALGVRTMEGRPAPAEGGAGTIPAQLERLEDDGRRHDYSVDATARARYQPMDRTREWIESNYHEVPANKQDADLVAVNDFWLDYARHDGRGPFLSPHLAEACRNFTEAMFALAVLDLPLQAPERRAEAKGPGAAAPPSGGAVVFRQVVREVPAAADAGTVLVSENFFLADERDDIVAGERRSRFVTGQFAANTLYGCEVVVTNPTSALLALDLLLQIPAGAVPARGGFLTRGFPLRLEPYAVHRQEYSFAFPREGVFEHFPAHASRDGVLFGAARPTTFTVVALPPAVDTGSWASVAARGTGDEVLAFLERDSPERLDLDLLVWRLKDRGFFDRVVALLTRRHVYRHAVWSYGFYHGDPATMREYLRNDDVAVMSVGDRLDSPLLAVDPVARGLYAHLEYEPLVNPRAHGQRRQFVSEQYPALLKILSYKAGLDDADLLALTYYLLLQDRVEEAARLFARVDRSRSGTGLQYDYLRAYLDCFTPDHQVARAIAESYHDYPVERWRSRFREVLAQLDEAEGKTPASGPGSARELQDRLAAAEPALDLALDGRRVTVHFRNLAECRVSYYRMDTEVLFSRNPFVQDSAAQFVYVGPGRSDRLELPAGKSSVSFELPQELASSNVLVEVSGGGARKSRVHFASALAVQVIEGFGQLKATRGEGGAPAAGAYVKVYARTRYGLVEFYKDGYTDLRGRFDYAALSTDDLDGVERFSILVLSDTDGAVIREAAPPKE